MSFQTGIDQLLNSTDLLTQLKNRSCALVAHPASITSEYIHSLDALIKKGCSIKKAFGPQHGMRGDKQDNMIESGDYFDSTHKIPVVSLYGTHRKPTKEMLEGLDLILFDLQDVGCRIYTYITTLLYFLEACEENDIEIWVLDRPNPAGRPIDGLTLKKGEESFVGCAPIPTRHGLTIGELALWLVAHKALATNLKIIEMANYEPESPSGHGWPETRPWINPSPNANSNNMARCFPGTVLLEGVNLSEGRGTTIPLEVIGAPHLPINEMLTILNSQASEWTQGAYLRTCYFEPTFHKFQGEMCTGIQIHTDVVSYAHDEFKPFRLIAGLLKSLKLIQPNIDLWRNHDYEYEHDRLPIDVINGGPDLRLWVDNGQSDFNEFNKRLYCDEKAWKLDREAFLLY